MADRQQFRKTQKELLAKIEPEALQYDENDFLLVRSLYEKIAFFAESRGLINTAVALPLARGLHSGAYRKNSILRRGVAVRMPYVVHPLAVTRLLVDAAPALSDEDLDILLAAALCHDMLEDIPFPDGGRELYTRFPLDRRVYDTVARLSKRTDFTPEEEAAHFRGIQEDPLALLIKLSDRGNNVEDLYNMRIAKVHEYAEETANRIYPMCAYGREAYPALEMTISILEQKIRTLVDAAVTLTDRYDARIRSLQERREALQAENDALRARLAQLSAD